MYTESYAGDIDAILAAHINRPLTLTIPAGKGRIDQYGFTKTQRVTLEAELLNIGRIMMWNCANNPTATIAIGGGGGRIVLRSWAQAANLYQRLTRNDWYAGLAGETGKIKCKDWTRLH
jgi:hypothetical protein